MCIYFQGGARLHLKLGGTELPNPMVLICPHGPSQGGTWLFFVPSSYLGPKENHREAFFTDFQEECPGRMMINFNVFQGLKTSLLRREAVMSCQRSCRAHASTHCLRPM